MDTKVQTSGIFFPRTAARENAAKEENETVRNGHVQTLGLNKVYSGGTRALDNFHCEFLPGELVVLLGPSGCGKTTALRALTGLEQADSGQILLDGRDITLRNPAKRNMAMVFQSYSLFPHLTALENVEFGLRVRKIGAAERKIQARAALELVGLSDQSAKYTTQMSGGQQQRVALARALVVKPSLLALDEPLSALDAKVRVNLRDEIRRIQQESGITTLFVTHDQEEALAIADRVGVMKDGKIVQIGTPKEIYNAPVNEFVASFIGVTNRLPATVRGGTAQVLAGSVPLLPTSSVNVGEALALVRPESISITLLDPRDEGGLRNGNHGRVSAISFLGAQVRVEVKIPGLETIIAQLSPAEADMLAVGDQVSLSVRNHPVLVIPKTR
ncbi:ABC transporter ATP-binding protein [Actinomycetaceae bacterium TAE3-ERU4]|nr:ABC transporter ATP-binding protein [Actinomycetaceae bacterium TAE3-ERU4]